VKTQLLCTFSSPSTLDHNISSIIESHDIPFSKIFVLENADNYDELMCTYNVSYKSKYTMLPDTISVHRKKETSTLYTINALNKLIMELNNGILDKQYSIYWPDFRNMLLIVRNFELIDICTELYDVIDITQ